MKTKKRKEGIGGVRVMLSDEEGGEWVMIIQYTRQLTGFFFLFSYIVALSALDHDCSTLSCLLCVCGEEPPPFHDRGVGYMPWTF